MSTITYRIEPHDLHAHQFRVTLTLPRPDAAQRLSLPVWIPGSYLVREFARHLSRLEARQGGKPVPMAQLDKTTWQANCAGRGALTLSWLVYAFDTSVRAAFLDEILIDLIALSYQYVYRLPTAEGASTLSPNDADSAAMARQPVQWPAATCANLNSAIACTVCGMISSFTPERCRPPITACSG